MKTGPTASILQIVSQSEYELRRPVNKFGWTALHAAAYYGRIDVLEYLVFEKMGEGDSDMQSKDGWTAPMFAFYGKQKEALRLLLVAAPFECRPDLELKNKKGARLEDLIFAESDDEWSDILETGLTACQPED